MKHVQSGQCMTANDKKDPEKFLVGQKTKRLSSKRNDIFLAPCEEGNHGKQRWYLERALFS